jgi:hypothetical protein
MTNTQKPRKSLIVSNPMTRLAYDKGARAAQKNLDPETAFYAWLDRHLDTDGDEEDAWVAGFDDNTGRTL